MAAAASPRVSGLDFEVRLGPLAGLGRCLVLGPEQELQFRELDIRDSSQAASQDPGHDAYNVNNRQMKMIDIIDIGILLSIKVTEDRDGQQTNS